MMLATVIAILITSSLAVISPSPTYNHFIRAGKNDVFLTTDSSSGLASYTFTIPFLHIINPTTNPVIQVFYTIEDIQAQLFNARDPTDNKYINVEYAFNTLSTSDDHIVTAIHAYLYIPFFRKFTFRYLLFQQGQMWLGRYLICQNLKFANGAKTASHSLPSNTNSTSTLQITLFLSSLKIRIKENDLKDDKVLTADWSWVQDVANNEIEYTLTVQNSVDQGQFVINYVCIVIDKTAIQKDFINYKFKAAHISFPSSTSLSLTYFTTAQAQEYHFFGLSSVDFGLKDNDPSFDFTLTENYPSIEMKFLGRSSAYTNRFRYSYFYFLRLFCNSNTYTIFDNATLNCITCSGITYFNASLVECLPCRYDCLACKNHYQCTSCDSAMFRTLSSTFSCIPISGYYENNQTLASPCVAPCITCAGSASNCTSCVSTSTVALNSCVPCSNLFEGCSQCQKTYCISCSAGYTQINSTYCNLPCTDSNCLVCDNSNTTKCEACASSFVLVNNLCFAIGTPIVQCGNGILQAGQICDDGNLDLKDGCSDQCVPEPYYNCYQSTTPSIFTIYCAYTKPIEFTLLSIQKIPTSNLIQLVLQVEEYKQSFWKNSEVLNCWFIDNIKYTGMSGRYLEHVDAIDKSKLLIPKLSSFARGSLIYLQFEYLEALQNKHINLRFDTSNSLHSSLIEIPSTTKNILLIPQNNHYAYLYSPDVYSRQQLLETLFMGISILSYFLLLVSLLIGNKRIIAEYIVILQIAYASLITLPGYNGMDYSLVSLKIANNGYNILEGTAIRPFQDQLSSQKIKGMYSYSQFIYNVNLGLVFILIPLIVGLIAFIMSCIKSLKEETIKTVEKVQRLCLGQYVYSGLIVGGCSIGFASAIQIQYGMKEIESSLALISCALPFILLPIYVIYIFIRIKKSQWFGEYSQILSFTLSSLVIQICISLIGLFSGLFLSFFNSTSFVNFVIICICTLLFMFCQQKRQFKKGLDSYRTQINLISLIIIQLPFAYTNLHGNPQNFSQDDLIILLPLFVAVVLSVGLILNLTFFIYLILKKIRLYLSQSQQQVEDLKIDQTDKSFSPQMKKPTKVRKGFIDTQTQEQSPLQKMLNKEHKKISITLQDDSIQHRSILKNIKPALINHSLPQQQAIIGTIEQKKMLLSTISKMEQL